MKILYPSHVTGFETQLGDDTKEAETELEEMIFAIFYLDNADKSRFSELKKRIKNEYV